MFFINLLPTIKGSLCTIKREIRAEVAKSAVPLTESIKHGCCFTDRKMKQIGKCLKSCILFEDGQMMIAVAAKKWLWSYGTFLLSLWAESLTLVIVNKKLSLFYKSWLYRVSNCKINCGIKLHAQWLMSCYWAYGFTVRPTPSCQIFFFLFLFEQSKQPTEMATMENFILRLQNRTYKLQSQSSRLYPLLWVIKLKLFIMCLLLVPFFFRHF